MRLLIIFALVIASLMNSTTCASELEIVATNLPASIELRDQYDAPHKLVTPLTNLTLLAIADKKGSDQVGAWIAAVKMRYEDQIDIRGLADLAGAPPFLQGRIRKQFQKTCAHPVMLDWSGKVCAQLGYRSGTANILVLGRDGRILARFSGPASESNVREATLTLDAALALQLSTSTLKTTKPVHTAEP